MSDDIKVTDGTILEALNGKIDYDGGNYAGSGLEEVVSNYLAENAGSGLDNKITNCLLEVPQNIKLELADGVLTLKAGSIVIVPNGFEEDGTTPKFDYVTVASDTTFQGVSGQTGSYIVSLQMVNKSIGWHLGSNAGSGAETTSTSGFYYRTDLNEIYYKNNTSTSKYCFPFCFVNISSGVITSIDQTFNGMGYIGSTVWLDKGVKGLIPNGRNEDGSLKNIEFTTDKVLVNTYASANGSFVLRINNGNSINATAVVVYDEDKNLIYIQNKVYPSTVVGTVVYSSGVITLFNPKQPFRAVDYNDIAGLKAYITETYVNGTSWYRVWSDGWCEQGGIGTATNAPAVTQTITLLKAYKNTNYSVQITALLSDDNYTQLYFQTVSKNTNNFKAKSTYSGNAYNGTVSPNWYACGYIA